MPALLTERDRMSVAIQELDRTMKQKLHTANALIAEQRSAIIAWQKYAAAVSGQSSPQLLRTLRERAERQTARVMN